MRQYERVTALATVIATRKAGRTARGFTLIEILVVLALIAVLTGLAVLSAGTAGSPVTREARRLAASLQLAADESRLQGRVLGLRFGKDGYSYFELAMEKPEDDAPAGYVWRLLGPGGAFAPRTWPASLQFELRINGRLVAPRPAERPSPPQVVLLPEGEFTPFSLRLADARGAGASVRFGSGGRFEVREQ